MKREHCDNLKTVYLVSLGCPKNRVDTEVMAGIALEQGLDMVVDPAQAHVIVVNTCAFIDAAREESIDTIMEMAAYRSKGRLKKLIVVGCLSQRYGDELGQSMPEVDAFLGTAQISKLKDVINGVEERVSVGSAAHYLRRANTPRFIEPGSVYAYIKIGDGCSRKCSFCAIPSIRGKGASLEPKLVVSEARALVNTGVREVILVAQDTSAYGRDLSSDVDLIALLKELDKVENLAWIRIMYLYPDRQIANIIRAMGESKKVVPYVDIPIQHASEKMLAAMKRGHTPAFLKQTIASMRRELPHIFIRTSVLVGHPGETNTDFDELMSFLNWAKFDRLGCFRYSEEEGTRAAGLEPKVSKTVSYQRFRKVMALGRRISNGRNRELMGRTLDVLIEGPADESGYVLFGRHQGQAPDIDGVTYVTSSDAKKGDIVKCKVVKANAFDLIVEPV